MVDRPRQAIGLPLELEACTHWLFHSVSAPLLDEPSDLGETLSMPPQLLSKARRSWAFGLLVLAEFFYSWAWNTVDVLRPYIRSSLALSLTEVGSAYSAQGAGAVLGAVFVGQLADQFGRRLLLPFVMVGYGVLLVAGSLVVNYVELLGQRFVLGIFLGGVFPVVVGIYADLFGAGIRGRLASVLNAIFSGAIVVLGLAASRVGTHDWRLLFWLGGLPPLALSVLAWSVVPERLSLSALRAKRAGFPLAELFAPQVRRQTLLLTALVGLNFFAYQAFSGWVTTYLTEIRHLPAASSGTIVAVQFSGNILGCFVWGYVGDRYGRKANAWGLVASAVAIVLFLVMPAGGVAVNVAGFVYGFGLSCTVIWGPWLAELYPEHLRSTAAAIFHYGRLVSFFAPFITAWLAGAFGLTAAMMVASVVFIAAAIIWRILPETHFVKRARLQ